MGKERVPWWDKLNAVFYPYIGPPVLGPYDQEPLGDTAVKPCPLCGVAMSRHTLDRAEGRPTYLRCPSSSS